jgi:hypothetical protein
MLVKGSFEDFFYILIGLIWVGFSIYKGMQKKKQQQSPAGEAKKKSVLETLMDEFLENGEAVRPAPVVDEEPSETIDFKDETKSEVFSYDDIYEESNYNEVSEVYEQKTETKSKLKTNLKVPVKRKKHTRFNLKKAVIYSEILNRRYS